MALCLFYFLLTDVFSDRHLFCQPNPQNHSGKHTWLMGKFLAPVPCPELPGPGRSISFVRNGKSRLLDALFSAAGWFVLPCRLLWPWGSFIFWLHSTFDSIESQNFLIQLQEVHSTTTTPTFSPINSWTPCSESYLSKCQNWLITLELLQHSKFIDAKAQEWNLNIHFLILFPKEEICDQTCFAFTTSWILNVCLFVFHKHFGHPEEEGLPLLDFG